MTRGFFLALILWLLAHPVKAQEFPSCQEINRDLTAAWHSPEWSEGFLRDGIYVYSEDGTIVRMGFWRCVSPGVVAVRLGQQDERFWRVTFLTNREVRFTSLRTDFSYVARRAR